MALKKTQRVLKREFKEKIKRLQWVIFGKCYNCTGFQADGYQDCGMKDCSLYPYRLKHSVGLTSKDLASYLERARTEIQCLEEV